MFNTICTASTVKMSQLPLKYPKEFSNCYYNSFPTFLVQNQKELKIVQPKRGVVDRISFTIDIVIVRK